MNIIRSYDSTACCRTRLTFDLELILGNHSVSQVKKCQVDMLGDADKVSSKGQKELSDRKQVSKVVSKRCRLPLGKHSNRLEWSSIFFVDRTQSGALSRTKFSLPS